jgi:hypothetical protein
VIGLHLNSEAISHIEPPITMPPRELSRAAQQSQQTLSDFVSRQLQIYQGPGAPAGRIDNAVRAIIRQEGITYGVYRKAQAGQPNWLSFLFRIINFCPQLGTVRQAVIQYLHNQQVNRILFVSRQLQIYQPPGPPAASPPPATGRGFGTAWRRRAPPTTACSVNCGKRIATTHRDSQEHRCSN